MAKQACTVLTCNVTGGDTDEYLSVFLFPYYLCCCKELIPMAKQVGINVVLLVS
jgi:hypothetical protein